jgi:putative two-component system response regulator
MHEQMENSFLETVLALANAMDARDTYTNNHSQSMAFWAEAICRELNFSEQETQAIRWASLLHDIGKIGVPDEILRKRGPLTDKEWLVMRRHPEDGARIVAPVRKLANVAPLIRAHQEHYDGSGYPDGLRGEEIPLGARLLSIVDAYGAMTDDRPYRRKRKRFEAVEELRRCKGIHFDPELVEVFIHILERDATKPLGPLPGSQDNTDYLSI